MNADFSEPQKRILRTLFDVETGQRHESCLRNGLHRSAMALVIKGMIWKRDRGLARPLYGMTDEGVSFLSSHHDSER